MRRRRYTRYTRGDIWIPPGVGLILVWLVCMIAGISLPFIPGPAIHLLLVGGILLIVFRHRIG